MREWFDSAPVQVHRSVRMALLVSTGASVAIAVSGFSGFLSFGWTVVVVLPFLAFHAGCAAAFAAEVRPRLRQLRGLSGEFRLLRQGLELLRRQRFSSAKLRGMVDRIQDPGDAPVVVRQLERLLQGFEQREKEYFYLPSLLMCVGTQLVFAVERWRSLHQAELMEWLDALAEFEALNCLACYAYEHPEDVFPELLDGPPHFAAKEIQHPLLPQDACVGNDVGMGADCSVYLVSGSNMAGKSTLLRSIGTGLVLALCGAPVRASAARISRMNLIASISLSDSLGEGRSKFLAEVERLRLAIDASKESGVLFLIDEIFSGTNSNDRRIAAEAVVRALVSNGAIGVLSTHDLAITELASIEGMKAKNFHMESESSDDPLKFDYLLKPGVASRSNALAIARLAGVDV